MGGKSWRMKETLWQAYKNIGVNSTGEAIYVHHLSVKWYKMPSNLQRLNASVEMIVIQGPRVLWQLVFLGLPDHNPI